MSPAPLPTPAYPATFAPPTSALSLEDLRALAKQVFGTESAAGFWLDDPNPELDGDTPRQLIDDNRGQIVKDFLDGILAGNYG